MRRSILNAARCCQTRCFSASTAEQRKLSTPTPVVESHSTTSSAYSQDSIDATSLVDDLLQFTRSLMDGSHHHIIAFSGGIDSSLAAALVKLSSRSDETVRAVLGISPAVPTEQVCLAENVADTIGIDLEKVLTTESSDEMYIENSGQACLACKTHLYSCLDAIFEHSGAAKHDRRLYNGTNSDDLKDPTRLGLIAADKFRVQSPLRQTTKDHVRIAAKHLNLPNWNYAASPCLRSRLALGVEAIPQHLERIEKAERHVRLSLDLDATQNLRVRLLSNSRAMVEVENPTLDDARSVLDSWQPIFREMGFTSVSVRSFKSGSVAT
eukprot:scaffold2816_cov121-Cylindrotheca_fusiformis.AAC.32